MQVRGALRRGIPARQADRVAYPDEAARSLLRRKSKWMHLNYII